ncbi:MAG: hypothetical protein IPK60_21245 [Sandaracinaceae bacterium]|nr:hypothetical protein [Sandaracinaceae bacterium]
MVIRSSARVHREGGITSVYYRPGEVRRAQVRLRGSASCRLNAEGNKLVALYRELFGELLFGDPQAVPNTAKYTLAPPEDDGADALACSDVGGIDTITLKEVQILWGGPRRDRIPPS